MEFSRKFREMKKNYVMIEALRVLLAPFVYVYFLWLMNGMLSGILYVLVSRVVEVFSSQYCPSWTCGIEGR